MISYKKWTWGTIIFFLAVVTYLVACIFYYFHAIEINQQFDTQGIRYSYEMLGAFDDGALWNWLTQLPPRKYPMLFVLPFFLGEYLFRLVSDNLLIGHVYYIVRAVLLLYAFGTLFLLQRVSKLLFADRWTAVLILLTSTNFFLFSTAARPHVVAAFWTLLTLYFSMRARQNPSRRNILLSFGSAACTFAVLQSGLFSFIFPLWALLSKKRSVRSVTTALGLTALFVGIAIAIGYPFIYKIFSGTSPLAIFASGMDHGVGVFIRPQLIPLKLWDTFTCDIILFTAAGFGVWRGWREKEKIIPILIYLALFTVVFGMQPITTPRFFIPALPLVALLAVPALTGRRGLQMAIGVLCILMFGRLAYLAAHPNTYQQASEFVNTHDGALVTKIPSYFLTVPETKYGNPSQKDVVFFILLKEGERYPEIESLPLCASFMATDIPTKDEEVQHMFFWQEVQWPLYHLLHAKALGINLRMYCLPPELN